MNRCAAVVAALLILAAAAITASAFDACRNVKFTITNSRNASIKLKRVRYFSASDKEWREENVWSTDIPRGRTFITSGDDLKDAEGDRLTKIVFIFEDANDRQTKSSGVFLPVTPECREGKRYGEGQNWAITGRSMIREDNNPLTDDECSPVTVKFNNGRDGDIKVRKIKFFNRNSGQWKTVDTENVVCAFGSKDCEVRRGYRGTPLAFNDANGEDLTKIVIVYSFKSRGRGANWSDAIDSKTFEPSTPMCREGKRYGLGQDWTIGAAASSDERMSPDTPAPTTSAPARRRRIRKPGT